MEIITFSAIKGGVGKTTLAFNYGEWLAKNGKHFSVFILFEYLLVSSIAYWFQPKAGKVYKTK